MIPSYNVLIYFNHISISSFFHITLPCSCFFFSKIALAYLTFEEQVVVKSEKLETVFKKTLENKGLAKEFEKHLQSEFSAENLKFWYEVEDYKFCNEDLLEAEARRIVKLYIEDGSDYQVPFIFYSFV